MARRGFSFNNMPSVRFNRSQFPLGHDIHTSMSVGKLYPIDWQEVLPGDTFSCKAFDVTRVTSSFLKPVMDNLFLDVYHFFVPLRLVYDNAEGVFGNPSPSAYEDNDLGSMPGTTGTVAPGSVADYLGLPLKTFNGNNLVTLAPFRAFALIYNQWFRNENVVDEVYVQKGEAQLSEKIDDQPWAPNHYTGMLPSVAKYKDYFTSCLPQPQKGAEVNLPLGTVAPVTIGTDTAVKDFYTGNPLIFRFGGTLPPNQELAPLGVVGTTTSAASNGTVYAINGGSVGGGTDLKVSGSNLIGQADLSEVTAVSINDQRFAFALQKMLERDALYGSRYNEYLLGHFGVYSPDARLQLPEYLGGGRMPLNITQVAQTSAAADDSPLANVAGYSWSNGRTRYSKGFTEHGIVMTVAAVRYKHSYQQGVAKKWTRFQRNDFYDPLFATIGQQPIYQSELYFDGSSPLKGSVFGYNEAWAEYRSIPSTVTGQMRSDSQNTLDIWHFADNYANAPSLTPSFIEETPSNVDRTLSVPSESIDNFIVDFYMDLTAIRVMPVRSTPGLIDHH